MCGLSCSCALGNAGAKLIDGAVAGAIWGLGLGCKAFVSVCEYFLLPACPKLTNPARVAVPPVPCRAVASPAVLVATVGQGVFRGLQDMRTPLGITLAANAINLTLDTVLILGLHWGVTGAATATAAAEWTAAAAYLGLLWGRRDALGGLSASSVLGARGAHALQEFLPFLRAGGAVLMRTALLLGTKTLASATAARWVLGKTWASFVLNTPVISSGHFILYVSCFVV